MAQEVVTISEFKSFIPRTDSAEDALLTTFLNSAISQVTKYLNCHIVATSVTNEPHSPTTGQSKIFLRYVPAKEVTVTENEILLTEDEDYRIDLTTGIVTRLGVYWSSGNKTVLVTYKAGWADGTIPADIKFAVMQQAKFYYNRRDEIGLTGKSLEGNITLNEGYRLLSGVRELLDPYRVGGMAC